MGWALKHTDGTYVSVRDDGDFEFTDDFKCSSWWDTEDDANWYIATNDVQGVTPEDSNGSSPPGNGQPGQP